MNPPKLSLIEKLPSSQLIKNIVPEKFMTITPKFNIPQNLIQSDEAIKLLNPNNSLVKGLNKLTYKYLHVFENEGNELGALPLFFFVIIWMQGNRYIRARNKDEKREVLTRDVSSGAMAFFITYAIQRFFAKIMEKKINVPATVKTSENKTKFLDWFSRKSGDVYIKSYKEIGETYSAKTPEQLRKYIEYIPLRAGEKFLNKLPEEAKKSLDYLKTQTTFFHKETHLDNLLKHNRTVKENVDKVIDAIERYVVPKAKIAKVVPDAIATITGIVALGWLIPRFNIVHTRKLYQNKQLEKQAQLSKLPKQEPLKEPSQNIDKLTKPDTTIPLTQPKPAMNFIIKSSDL